MLAIVGTPAFKKKVKQPEELIVALSCFFDICSTKAFACLNRADPKFQPTLARGNCCRTNTAQFTVALSGNAAVI